MCGGMAGSAIFAGSKIATKAPANICAIETATKTVRARKITFGNFIALPHFLDVHFPDVHFLDAS
jgi:hypothetical protein